VKSYPSGPVRWKESWIRPLLMSEGPRPFRRIIAARRLDIVHHQVEGRCGGRFAGGLFGLPDDDMRAAAKLEDGKIVVGEYRA